MKQILRFCAIGLIAAATTAKAQTPFFEPVNFRGAMGSTDWSAGWANWDPQNTPYPGDPTYNGPARTTVEISADINSNTTWTANNVYILKRPIIIRNATLTIEPGTVIRDDQTGDPSDNAYILVSKTGRLVAEGTATNPIVFTSGRPPGDRQPGDWGGLLFIGDAPTNNAGLIGPGGVALPAGQGQYEALPNVPEATYGGTNPDHDGGSLKYVRVEFAGYNYLPDQELNGITWAGCGKNTKTDYVQVSYTNDDSFEWFGGQNNAKHLIALAGVDDDFDCDEGYTGLVQFALGVRDPHLYDAAGGSNGFEHDNNTGRNANSTSGRNRTTDNPTPTTSPIFSNVTLVGPIKSGGTRSDMPAAAQNPTRRWQHGVVLRSGNQTSLFNGIVVGYPVAISLQNGAASLSNSTQTYFRDGLLSIKNTRFSINSTPDQEATSTNAPDGSNLDAAWLAGFVRATANSNQLLTEASTAVGFVQGEYVGPMDGSTPPSYATCNFTLAAGSQYLTGAEFTDPKLANNLATGLSAALPNTIRVFAQGKTLNVNFIEGANNQNIIVRNQLGQVVFSTTATSDFFSTNLKVANGTYFVSVGNGTAKVLLID